MIRGFWPAIVVGALSAVQAACVAEEPLNLLFFGNSFTIQDTVALKVRNLAVADGYPRPLVVGDLAGGQDLDYHRQQIENSPQNNITHSSLNMERWDFVVMQGYSTEATHLRPNSEFSDSAGQLYNAVLQHDSGQGQDAVGVLFETWARGPGHSFYPNEFADPAAMQAEVRVGYEAALTELHTLHDDVRLARVGDAFELLQFDRSLYDADIYHASTAGSMLASMMIYRTIYEEDLSDITYDEIENWARVDEATWRQFVEVVESFPVPEPSNNIWPVLWACLVARGTPLIRRSRKKT